MKSLNWIGQSVYFHQTAIRKIGFYLWMHKEVCFYGDFQCKNSYKSQVIDTATQKKRTFFGAFFKECLRHDTSDPFQV